MLHLKFQNNVLQAHIIPLDNAVLDDPWKNWIISHLLSEVPGFPIDCRLWKCFSSSSSSSSKVLFIVYEVTSLEEFFLNT